MKIANSHESAIQVVKDIAEDYVLTDGEEDTLGDMLEFYKAQKKTLHNGFIITCIEKLMPIASDVIDYNMQCEMEEDEEEELLIETSEITVDAMQTLAEFKLSIESYTDGLLTVKGMTNNVRNYYDNVFSNIMLEEKSFDDYIDSQGLLKE